MMFAHWNLYKKQITAFVRVDNSHTPIATVIEGEERPVRQMLRYAQLGEECERLCDRIASGVLSNEHVADMLLVLVTKAIKDTTERGKVSCPEINSLVEV